MAAPRSTREQLGVEIEEPKRPEQVEQPAPVDERPEWLPEKFKDPSELASSYKSLEDELRQRSEAQKRLENQVNALTEAIESLSDQPSQPTPGVEDSGDYREQLMAAYENDPLGTIAYLAQQYASQTFDQRFQQIQQENSPAAQAQAEAQNQLLAMSVDRALGETYSDWGQYKERIAEEIQADNTLLPPTALQSPEQTIRALSRVYENVKARELLAQAENGQYVQNQMTQMKRQAQTTTGNTTRPGEPSAEDEKFARLIEAAKGMSYSSWRG